MQNEKKGTTIYTSLYWDNVINEWIKIISVEDINRVGKIKKKH